LPRIVSNTQNAVAERGEYEQGERLQDRNRIKLLMSRAELIIQLIKVALGLAFGAYFLWWSLEVLNRLPPQ
jgi:hypothetical protein